MTVVALGLAAAVLFLAGSLAVVTVLVGLRLHRERRDLRREKVRAPVWRLVLTLAMGEPDEVESAERALLDTGQRERDAVVADAFGLVPKVRGEARERLRGLLRQWQYVDQARRLTASRSVIRRCRGTYRLGVLADPTTGDDVLRRLGDRDFAVRRTAMLALGSFPDDAAVSAMLAAADADPRLRRDLLASVDRIGAAAVPALQRALTEALESGRADRRGPLAAESLGLVDAIVAAPTLSRVLDETVDDEFAVACATSLGLLGVGTSVPALARRVGAGTPEVRRAAAVALGMVGGPPAVDALAGAVDDDNVEVARSAAQALQRAGPAGAAILARSGAPVAAETVALAALEA